MTPSISDRKRRRPDSDASKGGSSTKKAKVDDQRSSIFVRSLPPSATTESLADFFSQYYPVKHAVVVADQKTKESRGFGFVTFADANDAKGAQEALDKKEWDGRRIRVDIAEPRHRNAAPGEAVPAKQQHGGKDSFQKPPKLIVRNLPWSIKTSEQLAKLFISFGKVKFADLPQHQGKLKGFGFVTIRGRPNAEKALEAINGKVIDGRTLAVDWAVDKGTWEQQQGKEDAEVNKKKSTKKDEDEDDNEEEEEEEEEDDAKAVNGNEGAEPKNRDDQLDADLANFMKNYMGNMEDEEDEDENKDEEEEEDPEGLDMDMDMDMESEVDDAEKDTKAAPAPRAKMTDNSSTVFVRNVPFTTTDDQLKSFFGHFGNIRYARVVMDRITDKPAGTGFVCFVDQADAKTCIVGAPRRSQPTAGMKNSILQDENADPSGRYTMEGRVLQVVQAVGKEEAGSLAENSLASRREKDKRKLYLLAEGNIASNSPLYRLLTPPEIRMRQASAIQRKKMVQKNPMLHVSLTRLALRNIPRNLGAKELKELARKAVVGFAEDVKAGRRQPLSKEENARDGKDAKEKERERKLKKKGIVRQAKIVFEDNKGSKVSETSGAGKSRGYGFIEYASHRWALMGLRYLNGHQLESGDSAKRQRLIAEFAIENAQVVQRRRVAEEKSGRAAREKRGKADDGDGDGDEEEGEEEQEEVPEPKSKGKGKRSGPRSKEGHKGNQARRPGGKTGGEARGKGKGKGEGKGRKMEDEAPEPAEKAGGGMQQKLIARKRLMKKKKVAARGKH